MSFKSSNYLHPKHWPTWLGIALIRFFGLLPWKAQQSLGSCLGMLAFHLAKSRRRVSQTNIELAFPELNQTERDAMLKQHFKSNGKGLTELGTFWWMSDEQYKSISTIHGREHLDTAQQAGNVLLLGVHFTSLESGVRALKAHGYSMQGMYKPANDPLFESFMCAQRDRHYAGMISNRESKRFIKDLRNGQMSWYAPDQSFNKSVIFAPFFGLQTASLTATSKIAKIAKAQVLPMFGIRRADGSGYDIHILPALANFPSDDDYADTCKVNAAMEKMIRYAPEQYLWGHRRFKNLEDGTNPYKK